MKLRTILLPLAIVLGLLFPQAHVCGFLLRWVIASMMFLAFVGPLRATWNDSGRVLVRLMPVWLLLGPLCCILLRILLPHHLEYSWAVLLICLAPTGNAAPSVAALRGGAPKIVIAGVLVQHVLVGFLIPLWVWLLGGGSLGAEIPRRILLGTLPLVILPLLAAWVVRKILPNVATRLHRVQGISLILWACAVFLVVAGARYDLGRMELFATGMWAWAHLVGLAAISLLTCIVLFKLGARLGGQSFPEESSQILGQKNTILAIWIATTWFGPWVVLGPLTYVLWQNLYLAWQTR